MKYVIFSDIHGNKYSLEKMLEDLEYRNDIEGFIYCGDIMGYYYDYKYVIDIFKKIKNFYIVIGNHDKLSVLAYDNKEMIKELARKYGNAYLALENISVDDIQYLKGLPEHKHFIIDNKSVALFHGTPNNILEGRYYPDKKCEYSQFKDYDVVFLGHTHYKMKKVINNTIIINPGSLGQPRDGKGFSYCIFDFSSMNYEFKTINYDKQLLISKIKETETDIYHKKYLIDVLNR